MPATFLSCDWGTSALRVRRVDAATLEITDDSASTDGVAPLRARVGAEGLDAEEIFRRALARSVEALARSRPGAHAENIVVSGMASSSIGWRELPYADTPLSLDGHGLPHARLRLATTCGEHDVLLVSGLRTEDDVLRGEETETIGLLADPQHAHLRARCTVVLPGTHSKHLFVRDERIVAFRTYLTGELFEVLATASILRHSVGPSAVSLDVSPESAAFEDGVARAAMAPLTSLLFRVRTNQLFGKYGAIDNAAYLSGLLIGSELSSFPAERDADDAVLLGGSSRLTPLYARALAILRSSGRVVTCDARESARAVARAHALYLETTRTSPGRAPRSWSST